jgi:hypothetical protein
MLECLLILIISVEAANQLSRWFRIFSADCGRALVQASVSVWAKVRRKTSGSVRAKTNRSVQSETCKKYSISIAPDLGNLCDARQRLATSPSNPAASKDRPLCACHIRLIRYAEQCVGRPMPCLRAEHSTIVAAHPMIVCATPESAL